MNKSMTIASYVIFYLAFGLIGFGTSGDDGSKFRDIAIFLMGWAIFIRQGE
jgi:hypothetical protein